MLLPLQLGHAGAPGRSSGRRTATPPLWGEKPAVKLKPSQEIALSEVAVAAVAAAMLTWWFWRSGLPPWAAPAAFVLLWGRFFSAAI